MTELSVHTFKYGGKPHYSFPVTLLSAAPDHWVVWGALGRICRHHTKDISYPIDYWSVEFYWTDRHYTMAADFRPNGALHQYYCNIVVPPTLGPDGATWVDLDLDLLVAPDLSWRVVDEDEFAQNGATFGYPAPLVATARQAIRDLVALVEARAYPFDGTAERLFAGMETGAR